MQHAKTLWLLDLTLPVSIACSTLALQLLWTTKQCKANASIGAGLSVSCCVCHRRRVIIIIAYITSTVLGMCWLTYTIHVTLRKDEEDAQGVRQAPHISQFLKVWQAVLCFTCLRADGSGCKALTYLPCTAGPLYTAMHCSHDC